MSGEVKRLLASVPVSLGRRIKAELAMRDESMQKAIVRSLTSYLEIKLTTGELEELNLLTIMEQEELDLSEIVNG